MADVTTKTLNTRISLKYDSYANWVLHNPVLLKGEIAISTHENDTPAPVTGFTNIPNVAMKVGDGVTPYKNLKFVSALAADVYGWAKAAEKPVYQANEIQGIADYIHGQIQDTDTRYKLVKVDGTEYNYNLMSSSDGVDYSTVVSTIDLSGLAGRVKSLEDKVGSETVSAQINAKIDTLEMTEVKTGAGEIIDSIKEVDGIVTATKRSLVAADIPELAQSKITGLETALAGKQANLAFEGEYNAESNKVVTKSYVTEQIESLDVSDNAVAGQYVSAVSEADGKISVTRAALPDYSNVYEAKGAAAQALTDAKGYADGLNSTMDGRVTTVEGKVTTLVGSDAGKSVRTIANEELAAQLIPEGAKEALDTLQEIAAWIQSHPDDAAAMNSRISALETLVGEDPVSDQINAAIEALKIGDYAKAADLTAAVERIATLEGKSHEHANKALLDTYTQTEANLADAVAKKHEHANKAELDKIVAGDKAKWDAAVQTVSAGTGLTATKTGTNVAIDFDNTVTFVFDCGTSVL